MPHRPIVSAINICNYNIAKFLLKLIQQLLNLFTTDEYTTAYALDFVNEIKQPNIEDYCQFWRWIIIHCLSSVWTTQVIPDTPSEDSLSQFGLNEKQSNSF